MTYTIVRRSTEFEEPYLTKKPHPHAYQKYTKFPFHKGDFNCLRHEWIDNYSMNWCIDFSSIEEFDDLVMDYGSVTIDNRGQLSILYDFKA